MLDVGAGNAAHDNPPRAVDDDVDGFERQAGLVLGEPVGPRQSGSEPNGPTTVPCDACGGTRFTEHQRDGGMMVPTVESSNTA